MATIKVFSAEGIKELNCFDILQDIPFLLPEEPVDESEEDEDVVDF